MIVGYHTDKQASKNGAIWLGKYVRPLTPVCVGEEIPSDCERIICFGAEALKHLLKGTKFVHVRRSPVDLDGKLVTATFDSKFIYPDEGAPNLQHQIVEDLVWFADYEGETPELPWASAPVKADVVGFDVETTAFEYYSDDERMRTVGVATNDSVYASTQPASVREILTDEDVTVVGHNLKFDYNWYGAKETEIKAKPWSTDVAAYLLDDNLQDNSLAFHVSRDLKWDTYKDMVDIQNLEAESDQAVLEYNAHDALASRRLYEGQKERITRWGLGPIMQLLMDVMPVFSRMERRGVYLDTAWTMRAGARCLRETSILKQEFCELAEKEINLNSPKQVAEVLYDDYKIPNIDGRSSSKDVIKRLQYTNRLTDKQNEIVKKLLAYRKQAKLWSSYFAKYPELSKYDGRIHTSYALARGDDGGTVTGRTSSRNPNLQNIPLDPIMRGCFAATPGWDWFDSDYTGLELCVVADLAREWKMIEAIKAGRNIHTNTMALMYNEDYDHLQKILDNHDHKWYNVWKSRRVAIKRINFGILYGIGPSKLAHLCSLAGSKLSEGEAYDMIDEWRRKYDSIDRWLKATEREAQTSGGVVAITGQRRRLPGAQFSGWVQGRALRQACNFPVQHTASTLLLSAMYLLDQHFANRQGEAHLLMNVHDQTAGEFRGIEPDALKEEVKYIMEVSVPEFFHERFNYKFETPLAVDINVSNRWS